MSSYTHTVKMIPLDLFHFSDDNKFRSKIKETSNGKFKRTLVQEYIQRSRYFPQQTSIIGALRYMLLSINGQIPIKDIDKAHRLIGEKSWTIEENTDLGKIHSISPIFMYDGDTGEDYQFNSKHYYLSQPYTSKPHKLIDTLFNSASGANKVWENFNDKSNFKKFLHKLGAPSECVEIDQELFNANKDISTEEIKNLNYGLFIKSEKVGIDKVKNNADIPEALYKMHQYKLNTSCHFRLYANLDLEDNVRSIIPMGADGHVFIVEIEKNSPKYSFEQITPGNHIVSLLSDSFLNLTQYNWIQKNAQFFACDSVPFRYIKTKVTKGNEYYTKNPLTGKKDEFQLSNRKINLLSAGSVFYFKNDADVLSFTELLKEHSNMRKIGYNMYWNHN